MLGGMLYEKCVLVDGYVRGNTAESVMELLELSM